MPVVSSAHRSCLQYSDDLGAFRIHKSTRMLLLIDNYDSFVHNLSRHFERLGQETHVVRNDEVDVVEIRRLRPDAVVLSPGPCTPNEAGVSLDLVRTMHAELPILGVCLGHQAIAQALGGSIVSAAVPVHGQASLVRHDGAGLFAGVPSPLRVGRYHSLAVQPSSLPRAIRPTAWTDDGVLMAFQHERYPIFGVQFHPESILTEHGYDLLANFLKIAGLQMADRTDLPILAELCEPPLPTSTWPDRPVTF
jgi:anthranilate synthase/aminodeoxychorismate synthase-like glutamine amidotransferase